MRRALFRYNVVTGHRGNPEDVPENTIPGFVNAIELGCDFIETDVRQTADGNLVLCHDETTGRTCNKNLVISKSSIAELRLLDASEGFNTYNKNNRYMPTVIPTLDEALKLAGYYPHIRFSFQPKSDNVLDICKRIKAFGLGDKVAFNDGNLRYMIEDKRILPESIIFYDLNQVDQFEQALIDAIKYRFNGLVCNWRMLNKKRVDLIKAAGLEVGVWTVNSKRMMEKFLDMGVFRFYTDNPKRLIELKQ